MKNLSKMMLGAVFVLALCLVFSSFNVLAGTSSTGQVTIQNTGPTSGAVALVNQVGADTNITLAAGQTVIVTATATITDVDGGADITTANGTLYHETSTLDAEDDENKHITNSSCTLSEADGNTKVVTCSFTMDFMALPLTWTASITAADTEGESATGTVDTQEVNTLAALDVTTAIVDMGSRQLGANSSSAATMTVKSQGNVVIDTEFRGTNYACDSGTIPVVNTRYSLVTGNYDSMSTNLSEVDAPQTGFDLVVRTGGVDSTKNEFWTIKIPDSGVSGTCTNIITVTAIAS